MATTQDFKQLKFDLLSLNTKGIRGYTKRQKIFTYVDKQNPDIIFLQETHSTKEIEAIWKKQGKGDMFFSHGSNNSKGVLTLIKNDLDFQLVSKSIDDGGRYIILKAIVQETLFLLVNIYAPDKEKEQVPFFENLKKLIKSMLDNDNEIPHILIGGDHNAHLNQKLDSDNELAPIKRSVKEIEKIMIDFNLVDIRRLRNPEYKRYTWRQKTPLRQRRLDYWLVSDEIQEDIEKADILPAILSDHSAIILKINSVPQSNRGPYYWKFNTSLLSDENYSRLINSEYINWLKEFEYVSDKRVLWDLVKYRIRQTTMKYSKQKAAERRCRMQNLHEIIKTYEKECEANPSQNNYAALEEMKLAYDSELDHIVKGCIVRSRINWYENGEKK